MAVGSDSLDKDKSGNKLTFGALLVVKKSSLLETRFNKFVLGALSRVESDSFEGLEAFVMEDGASVGRLAASIIPAFLQPSLCDKYF